MAQTLYEHSTIVLFFDMWDNRISEEKPAYRPHEAWLSSSQVASIQLTIKKHGTAPDEVKTLAGGGVTPSGKAGQWKATFNIDGGPGAYAAIFKGTTSEGYVGVQVTKIRAKAWPA
jgi:hypothetical protein